MSLLVTMYYATSCYVHSGSTTLGYILIRSVAVWCNVLYGTALLLRYVLAFSYDMI